MIVIIDNYDSFTYNLYQFVGELNPNVEVFRNDVITVEEIMKMKVSHIIISPGPGYPKDAGISKDVIRVLGKEIPILGVCLGHQAIAEVFGSKIIEANRMVHGKTSMIKHNGRDLFRGIVNPLEVMRYHSLIVEESSISEVLEVTASIEENEVMGIKHKHYPIYGVQFHPESIMTNSGKALIKNFLDL
ncbi:aminodeoxychorismate/anthranilate synthase component II [Alkalibaculum sp. M08DMB]|uniref:Aminodeoxychorismate/anthranilate synthase component II n=1 Tax=Alkalibaculum sporogenes TaxID=2655001 RepID=A0A6A7KBJ1_9FIRM|nr:aminodeoxychorismate/anthranilate synthase component II [Alkalibaculum sporogenes]MPW26715.1 aminodeoxychorismate/anthranilate synthase component II [Alkalibaculum sporogenes]